MLRINVSVNRKWPDSPEFSSHSVCVGLEVECPDTLIHDPKDLQRKISGLLDDVDEAVLQRLQQEKPQDKNQDFRNRIEHAVGQNGSNGNGNSEPADAASTKQLNFIRSLAKKARLAREDLNEIVARITGKRHLGDDLSKQDAHLLIEELAAASMSTIEQTTTTTTPRHWSASALSQLLGCGEQYRLSRIERVEPEFRPSSLVFGICIHEALAELYLQRMLGNAVDLAAVQDVFRDSFVDALRAPDLPPVKFGKTEDEASLHRLGMQVIEVFCANQVPETDHVVAVEQRFEIEVVDGVTLVGYLDLVQVSPEGTVIVTDHKTAGRKPGQSEVESSLQRLVYLQAMKQIYPESNPVFRINTVTKTKTPTFVSIEAGHHPDDEQRLVELVKRAARIVEAGAFLPVDPFSQWRCSGCAVARACSFTG